MDVKLLSFDENRKIDFRKLKFKDDNWNNVEFENPGPGSYRVIISGEDIETVQDTFVVTD